MDHVFSECGRIIGPDEPIVYPEHLTEKPDYELELGVVLKKSDEHFRHTRAQLIFPIANLL